MKLRDWQSECISTALNCYREQQHFLCLATPGAGKSTMAAELAARMMRNGQIDFVLCFAPSISVVNGLTTAFESSLDQRFDGLVGAAGGAYTYQGMRSLGESFWRIFSSHRVLVVFDEIHHCAGSSIGGANAWGEEILLKIQSQATYTLALTGTPWRSDNRPIVLSRYCDARTQIQCDYVYGLHDAVRDGVCRKPSIVLIDNERLMIKGSCSLKEYGGVEELLASKEARYHELLHNNEALRFCLSLGCQKLAEVRSISPSAGGLIVASSIAHAQIIATMLTNEFDQTATVVTHRHRNSADIIEGYRHGDQPWIVSVGMISEGTDIPRLQVCCHLSRITTELYFRQVLGRVLRFTSGAPDRAWLYTFAEPQLAQFAERVADELPAYNVLNFDSQARIGDAITPKRNPSSLCVAEDSTQIIFGENHAQTIKNKTLDAHGNQPLCDLYSLECLGAFRSRLVSLFDAALP